MILFFKKDLLYRPGLWISLNIKLIYTTIVDLLLEILNKLQVLKLLSYMI